LITVIKAELARRWSGNDWFLLPSKKKMEQKMNWTIILYLRKLPLRTLLNVRVVCELIYYYANFLSRSFTFFPLFCFFVSFFLFNLYNYLRMNCTPQVRTLMRAYEYVHFYYFFVHIIPVACNSMP
jgi:hypothetical protein